MSRCLRSLNKEVHGLRGENVPLKMDRSSQSVASSLTGFVCMNKINCKRLCPLPSRSILTLSESLTGREYKPLSIADKMKP